MKPSASSSVKTSIIVNRVSVYNKQYLWIYELRTACNGLWGEMEIVIVASLEMLLRQSHFSTVGGVRKCWHKLLKCFQLVKASKNHAIFHRHNQNLFNINSTTALYG